jgi:hypothetical protein
VFLKLLLLVLVFSGAMTMANDNFDSGHVVIPVLHPNGEIHSVAAPSDTELADLHSSLVDAGYSHPAIDTQEKGPSAAGSLELSENFRKQSAAAWKAVSQGMNSRAESGFNVNKDGEVGPLKTEVTPDMPGMSSVPRDKLTFYPSDLAVVHTHPNGSSIPGPSENDVKAAVKMHKTVYTVSKGGLYAIDPAGKVTRVYSNADWMNEKKK